MEHQERLDTLEKLLDESSTAELLDDLATICYLKAQHLEENWQDKETAKLWKRNARKLDQWSMKVE